MMFLTSNQEKNKFRSWMSVKLIGWQAKSCYSPEGRFKCQELNDIQCCSVFKQLFNWQYIIFCSLIINEKLLNR